MLMGMMANHVLLRRTKHLESQVMKILDRPNEAFAVHPPRTIAARGLAVQFRHVFQTTLLLEQEMLESAFLETSNLEFGRCGLWGDLFFFQGMLEKMFNDTPERGVLRCVIQT